MQKLYYLTRDLKPTDNMHYVRDVVDGAIVPDMDAILGAKGQIVSSQFASMVRSEYGRDAVAFFTVPNMWGVEYKNAVRKVTLENGCIYMFYTGA